MRQAVVLHGWSDDSESFEPLIAFLKRNGYAVIPLFLGDYISLRDEVRIEDSRGGWRRSCARRWRGLRTSSSSLGRKRSRGYFGPCLRGAFGGAGARNPAARRCRSGPLCCDYTVRIRRDFF
jgi:hypothetical protein